MSKRKPHNMQRRYQRQAKYAIQGVGAAFVTGHKYVECVDLKRRGIIKAGPHLARAITNVAHKWSFILCVLGVDHEGKPYVKGEEHVMAVPYKQESLVHYLNEQHQEYIKKYANKQQMIAAGWIASPEGMELNTELAHDIFDKMGAFQ